MVVFEVFVDLGGFLGYGEEHPIDVAQQYLLILDQPEVPKQPLQIRVLILLIILLLLLEPALGDIDHTGLFLFLLDHVLVDPDGVQYFDGFRGVVVALAVVHEERVGQG